MATKDSTCKGVSSERWGWDTTWPTQPEGEFL